MWLDVPDTISDSDFESLRLAVENAAHFHARLTLPGVRYPAYMAQANEVPHPNKRK